MRAPIEVAQSTSLNAIGCAAGKIDSAVAKATYVITPPAAAPVFDPAPGAYTSEQHVTLTSATPGATFRYTTDGSDPTCTTGTSYGGADRDRQFADAQGGGLRRAASPTAPSPAAATTSRCRRRRSVWHSVDIDNLAVDSADLRGWLDHHERERRRGQHLGARQVREQRAGVPLRLRERHGRFRDDGAPRRRRLRGPREQPGARGSASHARFHATPRRISSTAARWSSATARIAAPIASPSAIPATSNINPVAGTRRALSQAHAHRQHLPGRHFARRRRRRELHDQRGAHLHGRTAAVAVRRLRGQLEQQHQHQRVRDLQRRAHSWTPRAMCSSARTNSRATSAPARQAAAAAAVAPRRRHRARRIRMTSRAAPRRRNLRCCRAASPTTTSRDIAAAAVTGGGNIPDSDPRYRQVTTATELVAALRAARASNAESGAASSRS